DGSVYHACIETHDTIEDLLRYVHMSADELMGFYRDQVTRAVLSAAERNRYLDALRLGLTRSSYLTTPQSAVARSGVYGAACGGQGAALTTLRAGVVWWAVGAFPVAMRWCGLVGARGEALDQLEPALRCGIRYPDDYRAGTISRGHSRRAIATMARLRASMNRQNASHSPWLPKPCSSQPTGRASSAASSMASRISRARVAPMNRPSSR